MKLTKDQQWKTVIDCLAVACVALDVEEIRASTMNIEFGFNHAWRDWSESHRFPSIAPYDFRIYAMKSTRRNGAHGAFEWERELRPVLTGGTAWWEPDDLLDFVSEHSQVNQAAWLNLAQTFVDASLK